MTRDRQRDRAAARAGVGDAHDAAGVGVLADRGQRGLDERLGLRARDQRAGADLEGQPVELAAAEDVGERLARHATPQQRIEAGARLGRRPLAARRDHLRAAQPCRLAVEQVGFQPPLVEALRGPDRDQPARRLQQQRADGASGVVLLIPLLRPPAERHRGARQARRGCCCCRRSRDCSSIATASISASISPSRMRGRPCLVSRTRWSVTRSSGKL